MNNSDLFDSTLAGGFLYPHTEKYEYGDWYCTTGLSDTSWYSTIRFNVQASNLLLHWTNSYLQMTGRLEPKDTAKHVHDDKSPITFIHNGACHLFDSVKFTIGGICVETINSPGHCSSLIFYVLLPCSKAKNDGLTFLWFPDTANRATSDDNHGFCVRQKYVVDALEENGRFLFLIRLLMYMLFGSVENFYALQGYPV